MGSEMCIRDRDILVGVTVDGETSAIISTVLKACLRVQQGIDDRAAVLRLAARDVATYLFHQVVDVGENTTLSVSLERSSTYHFPHSELV